MASIIELLLKVQLIDERQHDAVMSRTRSSTGGHIVQQVAEMGYATEGTVARAISVELGLPRIDLVMTPPEPQAVSLLDARTCADRFVLPVALRENGELLWLAMADPTDQDALTIVRRKTQKRVRPAVAGPSEILRAVRTLYSSPQAGMGKPDQVDKEKLAAIEIANDEEEGDAFEVVNVADDIDGSPLKKLAAQLGVEVPEALPSRRAAAAKKADAPATAKRPKKPAAQEEAVEVDALQSKAISEVPPQTDPRIRAIRALSYEDLFTPVTLPGGINANDLSPDDLQSLEALRTSMEKGALILRALAELCVEKGLFTRDEMKKRNAK